MTRNYQEPCTICGNALPKGAAKLARHYEKHRAIFMVRAKFAKGAVKEKWVQLALTQSQGNTEPGTEQGGDA